jgi:hypothetical protein
VTAVPRKGAISEVDFVTSLMQSLAVGPVGYMQKGAYGEELSGRPIALAIGGGREFEVVSAFGELRYQGCHILVFNDPLEPGISKFDKRLRMESKEIRKVEGHDVFVFDSAFVKESIYKTKDWERVLIARPDKNLVLCATQEEFLREVLRRRSSGSKDHAIPADRAIWKYLDRNSPAWMVRHSGASSPGRNTHPDLAAQVSAAPAEFRVVYLAEGPDAGSKAKSAAEAYWLRDGNIKISPILKQNESGATTVHIPLDATARNQLSDRVGMLLFFVPGLRSGAFEK